MVKNPRSKSHWNGYPDCNEITQLLFSLLVVVSFNQVATAQLTAQQLLAPVVEKYGPEYSEVEDAVRAFQAGDNASARSILEEAKAKHPELAPADVMMAMLHLSAGRKTDAETSLDHAVVNEPNDPEAFVLLADMALRGRQHAFAGLAYQHALQLIDNYDANPRRKRFLQIRINAGLASLSEVRQQYELAVGYLNAWAAWDPKNPIPMGSLGRVNFHRKDYEAAKGAFERLAELDRDAPPVEIALGRLYSDAGMRDEARQSMHQAIQKTGDDIRTRLTVAEWALSVGLTDLARENVLAALKIDSDSPDGQVLAGRLARQAGQLQEAESILSRAVLSWPSNLAVTNELARTYAESPDEKKRNIGLQYARRNFQMQRNRATPAGSEAAVTFAWLLLRNGRSEEAEAALNALPSGTTISSENAHYAARIYADRNKRDLAVNALRAALANEIAFPERDGAQRLLDELGGETRSP